MPYTKEMVHLNLQSNIMRIPKKQKMKSDFKNALKKQISLNMHMARMDQNMDMLDKA